MRRLGYKYEVRKKCYYVDNLETDKNKKFQKKFIQKYLKLEMRMHCWIQFSDGDFKTFCGQQDPGFFEQLNSKGLCYNCQCPRDLSQLKDHIEFHNDDHKLFAEKMKKDKIKFGGHISV